MNEERSAKTNDVQRHISNFIRIGSIGHKEDETSRPNSTARLCHQLLTAGAVPPAIYLAKLREKVAVRTLKGVLIGGSDMLNRGSKSYNVSRKEREERRIFPLSRVL